LTVKRVLLGVTGSIAAYKAADLVSRLRKKGREVTVVMTEAAGRLVTPLTFAAMSGHPVFHDLWDIEHSHRPEHVDLADRHDVMVIAPATANCLGKVAAGIADDMLTTTVMVVATTMPVLIAPAMNTRMYENPVVQRNVTALRDLGYRFVEPAEGYLACGDYGKGKMAEPETLAEEIERLLVPGSFVQDS
jgi:phosphopantothenoylcysteine decarboxylase/phosphopantothenate--cysteine ligase